MENQESKPGRTMEGQKRTLDIFWIIDCSGSMDGEKIQSVNTTIKDLKPTLEEFAKNNPKANFTVRAKKMDRIMLLRLFCWQVALIKN